MLDTEEIKKLIPQRYPFLMVDRVLDIKEREFIISCKNVSIDEEYFKGHFPDNPILPGALIAEAIAQSACILMKISMPNINASIFLVTNIKIRFFNPASPGDQLKIRVSSVKMTTIGGIFNAEATVGDKLIAKGEMTFACK